MRVPNVEPKVAQPARATMNDLAIPVHRFTVDDYHRMDESGIIGAEERVELLDGRVVELARIGSRHASVVDRLARLFFRKLGDRAIVRVQNPLRLGAYSEPVPDVVLAEPRADFYEHSHPLAHEALLVVEVSETTLRLDQSLKLPLYASAGVKETWIVDLEHERIEIHRDPGADQYRISIVLTPGDVVRPKAFPDAEVPVADLMGRQEA